MCSELIISVLSIHQHFSLPQGLEDVSKYPNLVTELLKRGWDDDSIEKLIGRNVLRAMEGAEMVSLVERMYSAQLSA